MNVYFGFKHGKNTASHAMGDVNIVVKNGVYNTTKKREIEAILSSELYQRQECWLVTDPDKVNEYLGGLEEDVLTKEVVDNLSNDVLVELAHKLSLREKLLHNIIRRQLLGRPITDVVREVLQRASIDTSIDWVEQALQDGVIVKNGAWYSTTNEYEGESFKSNKKDTVYKFAYNHYN